MPLGVALPFGLTHIMSQVMRRGLARPNRFEVIINPPKAMRDAPIRKNPSGTFHIGNIFESDSSRMNQLLFAAEDAKLPGRTVLVGDNKMTGPAKKYAHGQQYNDMTVNFRVSDDMYEKRFFDEWLRLVADPVNHDIGYYSDFASDIEIRQLNQFPDVVGSFERIISNRVLDITNQVTYAVKLIEAWPSVVSEMSLDQNPSNEYHTVSVTFTYRKWLPVELVGQEGSLVVSEDQQSIFRGPITNNAPPSQNNPSGGNPAAVSVNRTESFTV